jgi:hypothetical protein
MGRAVKGMFGAFIGKIGNLVGYQSNGQYIIRMVSGGRKGMVSAREKSNRKKFAVVQAWLSPLSDFVKIGFKNYGSSTGGYQAAVSYALRNAVKGTYPDQYVDPELIMVSGGDLSFPNQVSTSLLPGNLLQFVWSTEAADGGPSDQAMLLAYNEHSKRVIYKETAALRGIGNDILQLLTSAVVSTYHIYMGFVAQDRSRQANSVYLGKIVLPANGG